MHCALCWCCSPRLLAAGTPVSGTQLGYWALLLMTLQESVLTQFFAPAEQANPAAGASQSPAPDSSLYQATSMAATIIGSPWGNRSCGS